MEIDNAHKTRSDQALQSPTRKLRCCMMKYDDRNVSFEVYVRYLVLATNLYTIHMTTFTIDWMANKVAAHKNRPTA